MKDLLLFSYLSLLTLLTNCAGSPPVKPVEVVDQETHTMSCKRDDQCWLNFRCSRKGLCEMEK